MTKRYYVARHGATEKPGVLLGQYDAALSGDGRRQARELAQQLERAGIERVVCSALLRARQTAEILAERFGVAPEADARLNEISYGCWDGLRWDEIEQLDPLAAKRKTADWWSVTPDGGEPAAAFVLRVEEAWKALLAHPAQATVIVAHAAVNAVLLDLARHSSGGDNRDWQPDWERIRSFRQELGSCCSVAVETGPAR